MVEVWEIKQNEYIKFNHEFIKNNLGKLIIDRGYYLVFYLDLIDLLRESESCEEMTILKSHHIFYDLQNAILNIKCEC